MADEAKEVLPFRQKHDFDETYPYAEGFVNIKVNFRGLKDDLVKTAVESGVPQERAEDYASRAKFEVRSFRSIIDRDKNMKLWEKLAGKFADEVGGAALGGVNIKTGNCFLDLPNAVKFIDKEKSFPGFKTPKGLSGEQKKAVLVYAIKAIWGHEREHLLQLMGGKLDPLIVDLDKSKSTGKDFLAIGGAYALGFGLILTSVLVPEADYGQKPAGFLLVGLSVGALGLKLINMDRAYTNAEHEKGARKASSYIDKISPIQISFEK